MGEHSMDDPIDAVVERVLEGEVDAYADVVARFQKDVWKIASVALRDRDATGDLVQEIFVEAYSHLEGYELGRDFGAWIRGIARNQVRELLRRRTRESRLLQTYRDRMLKKLESSPASLRQEEAIVDAHRRCRGELPEHSLQMLTLRYDQSLSHEEISLKLGRSMEAVKQLLYRIHVLLRDCIQKRLAQA
jgi:RNA polymerase sigma-70 factor (ECF subfamily)